MTQKPGRKKFLSFVGPGFLVSLAYLDPGNSKWKFCFLTTSLSLSEFGSLDKFLVTAVETDLQAGADHRFNSFEVKTSNKIKQKCNHPISNLIGGNLLHGLWSSVFFFS